MESLGIAHGSHDDASLDKPLPMREELVSRFDKFFPFQNIMSSGFDDCLPSLETFVPAPSLLC